MIELVAGKMYQVNHWDKKRWILAEYINAVEAHSQKVTPMYLDTMTLGKEATVKVPKRYYFKTVARGSRFAVSKLSDIREASAESIEVVAQLRANVQLAEEKLKEARQELIAFAD